MEKIFVQIASYRDPQLMGTVVDCLEKASNPERVVFGICNQSCADDSWVADEDFSGDNFRVITVPHSKSRGACWARRSVQEMWDGEEYTLQLDSHHQFAEGWDNILIDMLGKCPSEKPILTGYVPQCAEEGNEKCSELYEMVAHFELDPVILQFKPSIRSSGGLKRHMNWSGHFMFTHGKYCEEVPYDPELYFIGEEVTMAVRSYSHGYDMFLPDRPAVWHEYGRAMRPKHWTDHTKDENRETAFFILDANSKKKVKDILLGVEVATCGLGTERTLEDYENAAGLSFHDSFVSTEAIKMQEAPIFSDNSWRAIPYYKYTMCVDWSEHEDKIKAFKPDHIAVFVRDKRVDFKCDEEIPMSGSLVAQWTSPPQSAEIWPYRINPLKWGQKVYATLKEVTAEKTSA